MKKRAFQPVLVTLALCALPWIGVLRPTGWLVGNAAFAGFLKPLPFFLAGLLAFVGVKLNQHRLFFVSLFVTAAYLCLQGGLPEWISPASPWARAQTAALAAPVTLGLIFLLPESRLMHRRSIAMLLAAVLPVSILGYGFRVGWPWLANLVAWQGFGRQSLQAPESTTLIAALFGLSAFLHKNHARRLLHVFLAVSLVPLWACLQLRAGGNPPNGDVLTALAMACQAGILVYAVFLLYWERVYLDELTGIPNRRALDEQLARLGERYAIAMVDIDHFKRFNDSYGHEEGDNVLRYVAAHLDQRTNGRAFRYGGEEFTVLFEGASAESAAAVMDRVRKSLSDRLFTIRPTRGKIPDGKGKQARGKGQGSRSHIRITFSSGVAEGPTHGGKPEEVRNAADEALYGAKESGRNCVALAEAPGKRRRTNR